MQNLKVYIIQPSLFHTLSPAPLMSWQSPTLPPPCQRPNAACLPACYAQWHIRHTHRAQLSTWPNFHKVPHALFNCPQFFCVPWYMYFPMFPPILRNWLNPGNYQNSKWQDIRELLSPLLNQHLTKLTEGMALFQVLCKLKTFPCLYLQCIYILSLFFRGSLQCSTTLKYISSLSLQDKHISFTCRFTTCTTKVFLLSFIFF